MSLWFVVRFDVLQAVEHRLHRWVRDEHFPDLLRAGFDAATYCVSVFGSPRVMNLYEIPEIDVLTSKAYLQVGKVTSRPRSDFGVEISDHTATIYRPLDESAGQPWTVGDALITLRGDVSEAQIAAVLDACESAAVGTGMATTARSFVAAWHSKHPDGARAADPRSTLVVTVLKGSRMDPPTSPAFAQLVSELSDLIQGPSVNVMEVVERTPASYPH